MMILPPEMVMEQSLSPEEKVSGRIPPPKPLWSLPPAAFKPSSLAVSVMLPPEMAMVLPSRLWPLCFSIASVKYRRP